MACDGNKQTFANVIANATAVDPGGRPVVHALLVTADIQSANRLGRNPS